MGNQGDELAELKSPDSTILRFVYAVLGRPGYMSRMDLEETHPSGSSDLPNRILRAWEYDDWGNVHRTWKGSTSFATGVEQWTLDFNDPVLPTLTTVTDPLGHPAVYAIGRDTVSDVPQIESVSSDCPVCELSPNSQIDYDPVHPLLPRLITDGEGHQTEIVYNEHGLPIFKTEAFMTALARTIEWRYEGPFPALVTEVLVPSTSKTGEQVTSFDYDPTTSDLLHQTISGVEATFSPPSFNLTTSYTGYNAAGQPGEIDPPGYDSPPTDVTTFTYDLACGDFLPQTRTDLLIGSTTYDYDGFNRRTMVTDPNDVTTETQYDAMDRVTRVIVHGATPAGDLTTVYAYNRYGDLDTVTLLRLNLI